MNGVDARVLERGLVDVLADAARVVFAIDIDRTRGQQDRVAFGRVGLGCAQAREQAQQAEEASQEADHLAKFEATKQKMVDETATSQQEADSYAKQAADLQTQLASLQADHEKLSRELFDLQKQVELAKIDRRNADLEIQRTYDEVTQKIAASSLTYVPPSATAVVH